MTVGRRRGGGGLNGDRSPPCPSDRRSGLDVPIDELWRRVGDPNMEDAPMEHAPLVGGVILVCIESDGTVIGVDQPGEVARSAYQAIS